MHFPLYGSAMTWKTSRPTVLFHTQQPFLVMLISIFPILTSIIEQHMAICTESATQATLSHRRRRSGRRVRSRGEKQPHISSEGGEATAPARPPSTFKMPAWKRWKNVQQPQNERMRECECLQHQHVSVNWRSWSSTFKLRWRGNWSNLSSTTKLYYHYLLLCIYEEKRIKRVTYSTPFGAKRFTTNLRSYDEVKISQEELAWGIGGAKCTGVGNIPSHGLREIG